jgi:NTP pyrophosphatase (non-canonical NTP hydrolase)
MSTSNPGFFISKVLDQVHAEMKAQDEKWGTQDHPPVWWLAILGEEVGESNEAVLDVTFGDGTYGHVAEELIQVAAVAIQAVASMYRQAMVE